MKRYPTVALAMVVAMLTACDGSEGGPDSRSQEAKPPTTSGTTTTVPAPSGVEVPLGARVGFLSIPSAGVTWEVREGVDRATLRHGPGHDPATPLPGAPGTVVIKAHRTTYGAPFLHLDEVTPGDRAVLTVHGASHTYEITDSYTVDAGAETTVLTDETSLALVTFTPRYSARQRLVVTAVEIDRATNA